jgi:hypothetical protein
MKDILLFSLEWKEKRNDMKNGAKERAYEWGKRSNSM